MNESCPPTSETAQNRGQEARSNADNVTNACPPAEKSWVVYDSRFKFISDEGISTAMTLPTPGTQPTQSPGQRCNPLLGLLAVPDGAVAHCPRSCHGGVGVPHGRCLILACYAVGHGILLLWLVAQALEHLQEDASIAAMIPAAKLRYTQQDPVVAVVRE